MLAFHIKHYLKNIKHCVAINLNILKQVWMLLKILKIIHASQQKYQE